MLHRDAPNMSYIVEEKSLKETNNSLADLQPTENVKVQDVSEDCFHAKPSQTA